MHWYMLSPKFQTQLAQFDGQVDETHYVGTVGSGHKLSKLEKMQLVHYPLFKVSQV